MSKKNAFNTVTPISKLIAFIMFVTFPFIGFYLGIQYQKILDRPYMNNIEAKNPKNPDKGVMCTMEARLCPDGSYVGRSGPNCEFDKCPGEN